MAFILAVFCFRKTTADIKEQPLQLGFDTQVLTAVNKLPMADLAALEVDLKAELAKNSEIGVHLYADKDVIYSKMAEAIAIVQQAGITKLAFVTLEN